MKCWFASNTLQKGLVVASYICLIVQRTTEIRLKVKGFATKTRTSLTRNSDAKKNRNGRSPTCIPWCQGFCLSARIGFGGCSRLIAEITLKWGQEWEVVIWRLLKMVGYLSKLVYLAFSKHLTANQGQSHYWEWPQLPGLKHPGNHLSLSILVFQRRWRYF